MAQAAEICERAATRLEQGWCQGEIAATALKYHQNADIPKFI